MPNMLDYLDWRGDLLFAADPFNEVDSLILSELAYTEFEDLVPGKEETGEISIRTLAERFFERHSDKELLAEESFTRMAPFLLKKLPHCPRFADVRLCRYVNLISEECDEQMAAVTYRLPDGSVYAAFRGTDNTIVGWKEDFNLSFMEETAGQKHAAAYLTETLRGHTGPIRVGGHSKGGNFAVYAAAFCDPKVQEQITDVYTNDGPGFLKDVVEKDGYRRIFSRIRSIVPVGSVFGLLLDRGYPYQVVDSSEKGLMQHDALSWQVMGNHFLTVPGTSDSSIFMEQTLDRWIKSLDLEDRKQFVEGLFSLAEDADIDTASEVGQLKNLIEMMKSYRSMAPEEQQHLKTTISGLLESTITTIRQNLGENLHLPAVPALKRKDD